MDDDAFLLPSIRASVPSSRPASGISSPPKSVFAATASASACSSTSMDFEIGLEIDGDQELLDNPLSASSTAALQSQESDPRSQLLLLPSFVNYSGTSCYMDCVLLLLFVTSSGLIPLLHQPVDPSFLSSPSSGSSSGLTSGEAECVLLLSLLCPRPS